MKPIAVIAILAAAGVTGALQLTNRPAAPPAPAAQTAPAAPAAQSASDAALRRPFLVTQSYSSKCSTGSSICIVPAQPVGSPCNCGGATGTIIP